jgi:hypothetical protein
MLLNISLIIKESRFAIKLCWCRQCHLGHGQPYIPWYVSGKGIVSLLDYYDNTRWGCSQECTSEYWVHNNQCD